MELQAKDLRIGNYLTHKGKEFVVSRSSFATLKIDFSKPIPLTEEWLVKMGFENDGVLNNQTCLPGGGDNGFDKAIRYEDGNANTVLYWEGKFYYVIDVNGDQYGDNYTVKQIEYVHKFQNIYYEWEDEELTIKE